MITQIVNKYIASYKGLSKSAWLLSLVILINRSGSVVLFFLVLYLTSQLDYSVSEAGRMISVYGLGALAGSYIGGWLSDRIGVIKVMVYSLVLSAIGYVVLCYITNPVIITIFLFIVAVVAEAFRPANSTALALVCSPENRTRGFALNRMAINLGVTIGPAIGGFLAIISYRLLFWFDAITCLAAAVFIMFIFKNTEFNYPEKDSGDNTETKNPWTDYYYLILLFLLFLTGIVFVQLLNTWPLYLKSYYNLIEDQIGLLFAINGLLIVLFELPLIHSVERKSVLKIMAIGTILFAGGFSILPLSTSYLFAAICVIIWTFGEMLVFPLVAGFIANRAMDNNRGQYMGMFSFTFSLAFVIGPTLGSWIYDNYSPTYLWTGTGAIGIIIMIGLLTLERFQSNK
jgi:MFS family permease